MCCTANTSLQENAQNLDLQNSLFESQYLRNLSYVVCLGEGFNLGVKICEAHHWRKMKRQRGQNNEEKNSNSCATKKNVTGYCTEDNPGKHTFYRTIQSYGLCCQVFSNISAEELDPYRLELSREFPFFGEEMMKFLLQERRNKVQIMHLWNSIHRVDEGRVRERKKVGCSTHLWHLDTIKFSDGTLLSSGELMAITDYL